MSSVTRAADSKVEEVGVPEAEDEFLAYCCEQGWSDGLPMIHPTPARIEAALAHLPGKPDDIVGVIPPGRGAATNLNIAINSVMAGCEPRYLPVVAAAIRAVCAEEFNLYGIQATTNPVAVGGFISGPAADKLGYNSGWNCLGQGNRANATTGRAIRLILMNVGGARPGEMDRATHGQPAKYSFFFAENLHESPWQEEDSSPGPDTSDRVTVLAPSGTVNVIDPTGDADELISTLAATMKTPGGNDSIFNGEPWLILSPEHAKVLADGGYSKTETQKALWSATKLRFADFSKNTAEYWVRGTWEPLMGKLTADSIIPMSEEPTGIRIVVAGGPSIHSVFVPTFGDTRSVTVPIVQDAH